VRNSTSTDNLKDVTLTLSGRVLSSMLEISQCTNLTINFHGPVPAVTQIDPEIDNLTFCFATGCEPGAFVVAPRSPSRQGLGLAQISVKLDEKEYVFVDGEGTIDTELMISLGGKIGEQYKIEMVTNGATARWKMETIDKKGGGMPVLNENRP
jgi:hypothetical protein